MVAELRQKLVGYKTVMRGSTNPRRPIGQATKFCMVATNICSNSIWNLLHITLMTCREWGVLDFWKILWPHIVNKYRKDSHTRAVHKETELHTYLLHGAESFLRS